MLNISHLTKKYHRFKANDNISFMVNDGEIAVLAGPNGAGKSTAIKCIAGLLRFEGEIEINGFKNKSLEAKQILGDELFNEFWYTGQITSHDSEDPERQQEAYRQNTHRRKLSHQFL